MADRWRVTYVRFGYLADLWTHSSLMAAFERKADVQTGQFWGK
jgi:hypothetical protein